MTQKKTGTFFFILTATILNVILMSLLFLLGYGVYHFIAGRFFSPGANVAVLFLFFAASVAATFFIHKAFVRFLLKRTRMGKYIHPALLSGQSAQEEQKEKQE